MSKATQCVCGKRLVQKYIAIGKCAVCSKTPEVTEVQDQLGPFIKAMQDAKAAGYNRSKLAELLDEVFGIKQTIVKEKYKSRNLKLHECNFSSKFSTDKEPVDVLPDTSLIDLTFKDYSAVCYLKNRIKIATQIRIKQYDIMSIPEVNKRAVVKIPNPIYKWVSLEGYKATAGYMNVQDKFYKLSNTKKGYKQTDVITQDMLKKFIIDNDIKFEYKTLDMVFYDIETYNTESFNDIPTVDNGHIGMISFVHISYPVVIPDPNNIEESEKEAVPVINVKLFYLHKHLVNQSKIESLLSDCNINSIECLGHDHEYSMAYEFFRTLGNLKAVTLVAGFNSSSSKKDTKTPGYDLPFLIKKCQAKLTTHTHRVKIGLSYGTQYTKIDELPFIYFIDMQVLLANSLMPDQRNAMESFKLNEYMRLFGVKQKHSIGTYKQLQEQLASGGGNVSGIAAYCIYDSYGLYLLNLKARAIERILNLGNMLNVPLYHILYNTQANNLGFQLMRQYVNAGYCISYKQICAKLPYQGAFTYLNEDYKLKIVKNVSSFDFTSLYPSVMRANNLSPEALLPDNYEGADCHVVEVTDKNINDGKPVTYKFSKATGIVTQYLTSLFDKRILYKKQLQDAIKANNENDAALFDILQYNTKLCLNTLYGLMASNFPLLQPEVAITCTAVGRSVIQKTLDVYKETTKKYPIMCDTDSIYAEFESKEQIKVFQDNIHKALGNTIYNLEYEGTYDLFMMSKSKKSYIKMQNQKLTIKGLAWSKYTTDAREWVKKLFRDILVSGEIFKTLHNFYHFHKKQIMLHIENKSINRLRNYAKLVKLGGKSNEVKYLRYNYQLQDDIAYVVMVKATRKNQPKAELARSIHDPDLKLTDINVQELMNWLMAGVTKLIMSMKCQPTNIDEDSDLVYYRTEKLSGGIVQDRRDIEPVSVADYCQILQEAEDTNVVIHELFKHDRKYRVFLDIDYTNKIEANNVISYMKTLLAERISNETKNTITTTITSNQNKSFHIFFNVRASLSQMKKLAEKCKRVYKVVDTNVYAINKSMRSPFCPKINRADQTINTTSVHYPVGSIDIDQCVIHNVANTYELLDHIHDISHMIINTQANKQTSIPKDIVLIIKTMLNEVGISYTKFRLHNNIMSVVPIKEFKCIGCDKMHFTHNPYVIFAHNKLIARCSENKTIIEKPLKDLSITEQFQALINNTEHVQRDYRTLSTRYFNEPLPSTTLVAINSSVGTGKSVWLRNQLETLPKDYKIICVSFRRSFTKTFCESYGLENYLDLQGKISLEMHPRIMIQCDSLHRLEMGPKIDVLILDEIVSILCQLNSSMIKNTENVYQIMHCLLLDARQIIAMDALLYPEIAINLSQICNCQNDFEYLENAYKPYEAAVKFNVGNRDKVIEALYARIKQTPIDCKIAAFISSYSAIKTIYTNLINDGRKVLMLHGKDLIVDQALLCNPEKLVTMKELKMYWFDHLQEIYNSYDVLLYTSTITAGISIDNIEIDLMLGCYIMNTCSPLDFVQGMFRVRNRKDTEIYYQPGHRDKPIDELIPELKASKLLASNLDISGKQELQIMAECMTAQLDYQRDELTIQFLQQAIGFKLIVEDLTPNTYESIGTFDTLQLQTLYEENYIPSAQDLEVYEKIHKSGGDDIELELVDDMTYTKGQWISILKTYGIEDTPDKIYSLDLKQICDLFYYRSTYATQKNRIIKYELEDSADFNKEKYEDTTANIISILNRLNGDNMQIKTDPRLQKHLKDMRNQEYVNIVSEKFKTQQIMSKPDLDTFLKSIEPKFDIKTTYSIRAANGIMRPHGFKLELTGRQQTQSTRVKYYRLVKILQAEIEVITQ